MTKLVYTKVNPEGRAPAMTLHGSGSIDMRQRATEKTNIIMEVKLNTIVLNE